MLNSKNEKTFFKSFIKILASSFRLDTDKAANEEIHNTIQSNARIKGPNMVILILAIFIASIGLNMNSTAIVIGAMLISPLMGCIMAMGYGLATNNLKLTKKAFIGLIFEVIICIITSYVYFKLTPISTARSEILARTTPTIWDVLIALFGGTAGIIGVTRKEKSNVIPGVAIATALMPPLCTAGYGLAMNELKYFFGAFYLFFINSFFICISTFIIMKIMRIPKKSYIDAASEKRVKILIYIIGIITILPSIYLGYGIVKDSMLESNINSFIQNEFVFENTRVLSRYVDNESKTLEVVVFGNKINDDSIKVLKTKLNQYHLDNLNLKITQSDTSTPLGQDDIEKIINQELYESNQIALGDRDKKIELLESELLKYKLYDFDVKSLYNEIRSIYPEITDLSIGKSNLYNPLEDKVNEIIVVTISVYKELPSEEILKITEWLKTRTNNSNIEIFMNYTVPIPSLSSPGTDGISNDLLTIETPKSEIE